MTKFTIQVTWSFVTLHMHRATMLNYLPMFHWKEKEISITKKKITETKLNLIQIWRCTWTLEKSQNILLNKYNDEKRGKTKNQNTYLKTHVPNLKNSNFQVLKWPRNLKLIDFKACLPTLTIPYSTSCLHSYNLWL